MRVEITACIHVCTCALWVCHQADVTLVRVTVQGYMVELTSHQGSVGRVLQSGSMLLAEGRLTEEEENEIREQMNLLNSRWEHLRVASMERQSRCPSRTQPSQSVTSRLYIHHDWIQHCSRLGRVPWLFCTVCLCFVFLVTGVVYFRQTNSLTYLCSPVQLFGCEFCALYTILFGPLCLFCSSSQAVMFSVGGTFEVIYCYSLFLFFFFSLRLHEVLMDLQNQQLKQLTDWLELTEGRINRMEAQPLGPDLVDIKHQVEEHKV